VLRARELPIPMEFAHGDYESDPVHRGNFHRWLGGIWAFKDEEIEGLLKTAPVQGNLASH
jgi:hypothetical protein